MMHQREDLGQGDAQQAAGLCRRRRLGSERQVKAQGVLSRLAWGWALLVMLLPLGACDFVAQKKLVAGESTEADVRRLMGEPELIWEDDDGSRTLEYPRGPQGLQTWLVWVGPDGRYRRMEQVLVEEHFRTLKPGMDRDAVRQVLGKPGEITRFARQQEEVWSWRFKAVDTRIMFFNAHFDLGTGLLKRTDTVVDWRREGGSR